MNQALVLSLVLAGGAVAVLTICGLFGASRERREVLDRIKSNPIHLHPVAASHCEHEPMTCVVDGKLGAFEQRWGLKSENRDLAIVRFCVKCRLLYWHEPE